MQFKEFVIIRNQILDGPLTVLKGQFIHVLYKFYIQIIKKFISIKLMNRESFNPDSKILKYCKDFENIAKY